MRDVVALFMRDEGYEVATAASGEEALRLARVRPPCLILLDLSLPGLDGAAVLTELRRTSAVPVIFLTANASQSVRTRLLRAGADDYITKPFHVDELTARVRAVLRRTSATQRAAGRVRIGPTELDLERRLLIRDGEVVKLGRTEWALLRHLAMNAGKVVLNSELLRVVWGDAFVEDHGLVRIAISRLRRKLGAPPHETGPIRTYAGVGYSLDLRTAGDEDDARATGAPATGNAASP